MSLADAVRKLKDLASRRTEGGTVRDGVRALVAGAEYLRTHKELWKLLIVPALINAAAFAFFLVLITRVLSRFLSMHLPDAWWATVLVVVAVLAALAAVLFFGTAIFMFFGSILSAPFYGVIAERIAREGNASLPFAPLGLQVWRTIWSTLSKLGWFLLVQAGLLLLYVMPFAFGPMAYAVAGFFATGFFLALDAFDFTFDLHGMRFAERRAWCVKRLRLTSGFGAATFIGLAIPGINLIIPAAAVAGAALLYKRHPQPRP